MIRRLGWVLAPLLLAAAVPRAEAQEDREPPLLTYLEVGGIKTPIELDKPLDLKTQEGMTSVTLRVEPYREFPYAGLGFRYPRSYAFDADLDNPGIRMWTMEGPDCTVMVFCYPSSSDPATTLDQSIEGARERFGAEESSAEPASLKLGDEELSGTLLKILIGGQSMHQHFFSLATVGGTVLLILQDSPDDGGEPSAEYKALIEMLQGSFQAERQ